MAALVPVESWLLMPVSNIKIRESPALVIATGPIGLLSETSLRAWTKLSESDSLTIRDIRGIKSAS
jgi:hypothetical protein